MQLTPDFLRSIRNRIKFHKQMIHNQLKTSDIETHELSIDPYEPISVDPEAITEWSRRPLPNHHNVVDMCGTVKAGNWDIRETFEFQSGFDREYYLEIIYNDTILRDTIFYKSFVQHFQQQVAWDDTEYIRKLYEILNQKGSVVWGGKRTSSEEIRTRCKEIDALYNSMRKQGYQTQKQLGNSKCDQVTNEILIDIGRNGEYLLVDGKHRICIAQMLNLESVTVTVLVRHKEWVCEQRNGKE